MPEVLTDRTRVVFFETPGNPTLDVFDIATISARARAAGALTVVDNAFATPVNQSPLRHGADLVIYSATKYLGGRSDLTAGALVGPVDLLTPVAMWRKNLGQVFAPGTADRLRLFAIAPSLVASRASPPDRSPPPTTTSSTPSPKRSTRAGSAGRAPAQPRQPSLDVTGRPRIGWTGRARALRTPVRGYGRWVLDPRDRPPLRLVEAHAESPVSAADAAH
ncbi:PLP-dependent transferase [Actinosynnema sp. NPDC091369]